MTRVLVVEDSPDIARLVQRSLLLEGYEVDVANDGRGALAVVRDSPPDLIVLDLMLPDIDGMEICRRVRAMEAAYEQPPVPVLMLTALDAVPDRVSGLDAGADDYVPKPFAITELMARVRSLLRRSRAPEVRSKQREILTFEDLTLDPGARTVYPRRSGGHADCQAVRSAGGADGESEPGHVIRHGHAAGLGWTVPR